MQGTCATNVNCKTHPMPKGWTSITSSSGTQACSVQPLHLNGSTGPFEADASVAMWLV